MEQRRRGDPEKSVERTESRSGLPALQNRGLLSERQLLHEEDLTRMKEASKPSKPEPEEAEHRLDFITGPRVEKTISTQVG